jgi:hypothetical protein
MSCLGGGHQERRSDEDGRLAISLTSLQESRSSTKYEINLYLLWRLYLLVCICIILYHTLTLFLHVVQCRQQEMSDALYQSNAACETHDSMYEEIVQ